jgi:hypothetical protein
LEELLESAESEPVKLKAATEILDRAGVRAGFDFNTEVTVDVRPAASIIQERLQRLSQNALDAQHLLNPQPTELVEDLQKKEEIIDAEVVDKND